MTDQARKLKNEYQKQWRSANKDRVKAHQDKYWEGKAAAGTTAKEEKQDLSKMDWDEVENESMLKGLAKIRESLKKNEV